MKQIVLLQRYQYLGLELGCWMNVLFPGFPPLLPTDPSGHKVSNCKDELCILWDVILTGTLT